jgi:hypothetical protein
VAGERLLELSIRRGVARRTAAAVVDKVAEWIGRHGELLNAPQGAAGRLMADGGMKPHPRALDGPGDDFGARDC